MTIVLFDIDGTLVQTGGAGVRAMSRAFEDVSGIAGAFDGIPMAGRTDKALLESAVARAGLDVGGGFFPRFRARYCERLLEALLEPGHYKSVLPGVRPLLDALTLRVDVFFALLTGNCQQGAKLKLEYFDLWRYFSCGAFGDDLNNRNDLFAVAMQRAVECGAPQVPPRNVMVVGDTALDVACAAAAGARAVAVATGQADSAALHRCGADAVFEDLSDTDAFLRLIARV